MLLMANGSKLFARKKSDWAWVEIANFANVIQSTIASAERIFELLDEEEEIPEAADAIVIENAHGAV